MRKTRERQGRMTRERERERGWRGRVEEKMAEERVNIEQKKEQLKQQAAQPGAVAAQYAGAAEDGSGAALGADWHSWAAGRDAAPLA